MLEAVDDIDKTFSSFKNTYDYFLICITLLEGELYKPSPLFVRLTAKHVSGLFLARTYGHANQLLGP